MTNDPTKPKKVVDQKTLDMLAAGRAARAAKLADKKSPPTVTPPADKPKDGDKPVRCHKCWAKPCVCVKK